MCLGLNFRYQFPGRNFEMHCTSEFCDFDCGPNSLPNIPRAYCHQGNSLELDLNRLESSH